MAASRARRSGRRFAQVAWYDSPWRIAGAAVSIAATITLLAVVAALFVIPRALGGASLTVLTGSMEPVFMPGDVVVVRGVDQADVCTSVGIGDIVTFFPEPGNPDLITHRVVAKTIGTFDDGTDCRLITQGDNNDAVDEPVSPAQVRGKFMYGIPKLGWVRQWVQQNPQTVMIALAALVVAYLLWSSLRPAKTRVMAYGGDPGASPVAPQPALAAVPEPLDEAELALRLRELAVREREVAIREAELQLFGIDGLGPTHATHPRSPATGTDLSHEVSPRTEPVPIHTRASVARAATSEQS